VIGAFYHWRPRQWRSSFHAINNNKMKSVKFVRLSTSSDNDSVPLVTYLALWLISRIHPIFVEGDQYFCRKWQHELAVHPKTNSRPLSDEWFPRHNFPTLATWNCILGAMFINIKLKVKCEFIAVSVLLVLHLAIYYQKLYFQGTAVYKCQWY
jgi:hypothetical protein